jgi:hypothetical protein
MAPVSVGKWSIMTRAPFMAPARQFTVHEGAMNRAPTGLK